MWSRWTELSSHNLYLLMRALKVRQSQKQIMVSPILPKNKCWDNFQYIKLSQRSFFGRIGDTINCFGDLLTFSKWKQGSTQANNFIFWWSHNIAVQLMQNTLRERSDSVTSTQALRLMPRTENLFLWPNNSAFGKSLLRISSSMGHQE